MRWMTRETDATEKVKNRTIQPRGRKKDKPGLLEVTDGFEDAFTSSVH